MNLAFLTKKVASTHKAMNPHKLKQFEDLCRNQVLAARQPNLFKMDQTTDDIIIPPVIALPVITQVFPSLFATEIAMIQSLQGPVGQVFYKVYDREPFLTFAAVDALAGDLSIFVDDVSGIHEGDALTIPGVAGTRTVAVGGLLGKRVTFTAVLGAAVPYGTQITGSTTAKVGELQRPNRGSFTLTSRAVEAQKRILQARLSTEVIEDMQRVMGQDAEQVLINDLAADIMREIDRDVIDFINNLSGKSGNVNWSATPAAGWEPKDWASTLANAIVDADALVFSNRFKRTDYVLMNPFDAATFMKINNFRLEERLDIGNMGQIGVRVFGSLAGWWDVYASPEQPRGTIVVGTKGEGVAWLPYILMSLAPAGAGFYDPNYDAISRNIRTRDVITYTTPQSFATVTITA